MKEENIFSKHKSNLKSQNENFNKQFQINYGNLVLEMEKLNKDLNEYLAGLQSYCEETCQEIKLDEQDVFDLKSFYLKQSNDLVNSINKDEPKTRIEDNLNKIKQNHRNF